MEEAESLKSKYLYKIMLILLKYTPMVIALFYALNTLLALLGIDMPVLSNLAGMSLFTWIFMYVSAWVFKFCIYHRMFLYYILFTDIINILDYYIGIPISNYEIVMLHISLIGITLFIILYLYVKSHKRTTTKCNR